MKKFRILLRAAGRNQKGSILGIFFLMLLSSCCLFTALTLFQSADRSVSSAMERLGYGDFTVWVNGEEEELAGQIRSLPDTEEVRVQTLIFSDYEINGVYSDNEGQLLSFDGGVPYRFIDKKGTVIPTPSIRPGTVYISPSMGGKYGAGIGDRISFTLARTGDPASFEIAGYFEDAFMGSSMIDMKSFLICEEDFSALHSRLDQTKDYDRVAREGAMLHIFQHEESSLSEQEYRMTSENTDLSLYTEFTYSRDSIHSYMLLLQTILSGFLLAFSAVLMLVSLVISGHSLSGALEQERKNIAVQKTSGYSGRTLRIVYMSLYEGAVLLGFLPGLILSLPLSRQISRAMVSSTGLLVETVLPVLPAGVIFLAVSGLFTGFLFLRTAEVLRIRPMETLDAAPQGGILFPAVKKRHLPYDLALRTLLANRGRYGGVLCISLLLTFFLSLTGRMGTWLGPNGEGLMNAFSVAEHDLGVQPFNETVPMDEIERVIGWYSPIREKYELAMQNVTLNGQQYTANVLNDPSRFHVLSGRVCSGDEILITHTVAAEQGLSPGDQVTVAGNGKAETYTVSGIYMCANGMGSNIGMTLEGYSQIGDVTGYIWCYHYILEDGSMRDYAMDYLQQNYRGIDVHTNSWSGLDSIVDLLHLLIAGIYLVSALLILISVALISSKLFISEARDMAVMKSLGIKTGILRKMFSLRFFMVSALGSLAGAFLSAFLSAPLIEGIFRSFGIGEFSSPFGVGGTVLPPAAVVLLFLGAAWIFSGKIRKISTVKLISENEE